MPSDPSIYAQKSDPLSALSGAVGVANGIAQNRLLQTQGNMLSGEYQGNVAIGQAMQNAFDPATGRFDPAKYGAGVSNNPAAAYVAPQAAQNAANLQGTNLANQGAGVGQAQNRLQDFYSSALGPLTAGDSKPTRAQVMGLAAQYLHSGRLVPQDLAALNNEIPLDSRQIPDYVASKVTSTLPTGGAQPSPVATGVTPQGQPIQGTQGQVLRLQTGTAKGAPSQPAQPPGIVNTLPVGATDNINAINADLQTSAAKTGNIRNLTTALPMMEQLGASGAGPTSENLAQARSLFQTLGVIGQSDTDPNVIRDKIGKYLDKYVGSAPASQRSDMAQSLTNMSSPNLHTAMAATISLAKSAIGFDRMDAAAPILFQKSGLPPSQYLNWKARFPSSQDARAYSFDLLSPADKQAVVKSIGSQGSAPYMKFLNSLQAARDAELIEPPGVSNAGQ